MSDGNSNGPEDWSQDTTVAVVASFAGGFSLLALMIAGVANPNILMGVFIAWILGLPLFAEWKKRQ